ncbi:hypothetical protein F5Y14DRAFT_413887 [Nemania sp. NC0429]|nr:hypothetical protein F5Y14DRAFT_413887 [Nemania sp. NC0429]
MASHFQVQKPYVLATLPRPLETGTYVVGEVYGHSYAPASRKRKRRRAELTVGVDGEAINIYDVSSSRLVTSYPIPPQSRLSCPASSFRVKADAHATRNISRYTYLASDESRINKVTLFKDTVDESGKTNQVTRSTSLAEGQPVVWLAPLSSPSTSQVGEAAEAAPSEELLALRADGEIVCFDGESLDQKWTSSAQAMLQDLAEDARANFTVDFCRSVSASEVVKGIFKGDSHAFGLISDPGQEIDDEMEVLVLISSSGAVEHRSRHVHIVGRLPSALPSTRPNQGVVQLHVMPLVTPHEKESGLRSYRLDVRNGALVELYEHTIIVHDLTASIPKISSTTKLDGANSFLSLSKTSLLFSTSTQLSVFNPVYKSLQNTVDIDLAAQGQTDAGNNDDYNPCQLVNYFSPLERAIAIVGSNLVAIQLEAPTARRAKRRAEGLLIDSIGRGLTGAKRCAVPSSRPPPNSSVFSHYLPGSIRGDYWEKWTSDEETADSLLNSNDITGFEAFLAEKFGVPIDTMEVPNGDGTDASTKKTVVWRLPKSWTKYPAVDRRWILYAISRSFQWNNALRDDSTVPRLIFQLPQSNILNYLVDAGHLTLSNLRAAFRSRLTETEAVDAFLAEELVARLSETDPSLELLIVYLSATSLGAREILLVIRTLMRSLELVVDKPPPQLMANGTAENVTNGDDSAENENIGMELDDLEDEIQKTASYLTSEEAGIRGRGLSIAFTKLGACPRLSTVRALQPTFKPHEIISLMYVLRIELVKGGWTDRYVEVDYRNEDVRFDAPPDGVIELIADLLGVCLDSLGPGGWLLNDVLQAGDDAVDFVDLLMHEVSAALEGVEEMCFLRNLLAGPLKYCEEVSKKTTGPDPNATKPVTVRINDVAPGALPLGLKPPSQRVSSHKVVSGGEIAQRSQREMGHLISQKVGSYSLERIVI